MVGESDFFQKPKRKDSRMTAHLEEKTKQFRASKMEELVDTKCTECTTCKKCKEKIKSNLIAFATVSTAKNDAITEKLMKNQLEKERNG